MKKLSSKDLLAETLHEMMCHTSFEEISVTDILQSCGVSRTTFYRHFYSKTDLLFYLFDSKIALTNFYCFYAPSYERERDFFRYLQQDSAFFLHAISVPELLKKWQAAAQKSLIRTAFILRRMHISFPLRCRQLSSISIRLIYPTLEGNLRKSFQNFFAK